MLASLTRSTSCSLVTAVPSTSPAYSPKNHAPCKPQSSITKDTGCTRINRSEQLLHTVRPWQAWGEAPAASCSSRRQACTERPEPTCLQPFCLLQRSHQVSHLLLCSLLLVLEIAILTLHAAA